MAILSALLVALAAVVATVFVFYYKKFRFWKDLNIPHITPHFPFGISFTLVQKNVGEAISEIYKQFPNQKFVGFWLLFRPLLLVRDPDLIKTLCVRDFMTFHDRGTHSNPTSDPLTGNLFMSNGSHWRNLRVKMTPTFTSGKMKMMFPILVECSKQFKATLDGPAERGEVVEVKDYAARFTTDIISLVAFGIEAKSLENPNADFRRYGARIIGPTLKSMFRTTTFFLIPSVAKFLNIRFVDQDLEDFFVNAIRDTMEYREKNDVKRNDFLHLLMQLKNDGKLEDEKPSEGDSTKFTFEEVVAQAFNFFFAGFETSATTIQYALYELAKHPDIQKKTRDEMNKVLVKYNGELTYEAIAELDLVSRVIDETLRLYPAVPFLQRESNQDYQIPDTKLMVPKNTGVIIDVLGMQRDPKYYKNPETFDPDRFTEEEKAKRQRYSYLPFGEGPRNCIGARFGLMQTKLGIATLLLNYEFSVTEKTPIPLVFDSTSFILSPKGGMYLKINKLRK